MLRFGDVETAEREAVIKQQAGHHQSTSTRGVTVARSGCLLSGALCRGARASYLSQGYAGRYRQPSKLPCTRNRTKIDSKSTTRCNIQEQTPFLFSSGRGAQPLTSGIFPVKHTRACTWLDSTVALRFAGISCL